MELNQCNYNRIRTLSTLDVPATAEIHGKTNLLLTTWVAYLHSGSLRPRYPPPGTQPTSAYAPNQPQTQADSRQRNQQRRPPRTTGAAFRYSGPATGRQSRAPPERGRHHAKLRRAARILSLSKDERASPDRLPTCQSRWISASVRKDHRRRNLLQATSASCATPRASSSNPSVPGTACSPTTWQRTRNRRNSNSTTPDGHDSVGTTEKRRAS